MGVTIRGLVAEDRKDVHEMLVSCGAFHDEEIRVALEMFDAGVSGDYELFGAELGGLLRGYACIGKAPLTLTSWYMYWICVHPDAQGGGVGRALQKSVEEFVRRSQGERLVLETSGRPEYARARRFYEDAGFEAVGRIRDFYMPGDDCVIYSKPVRGPV